MSEPRRNPSGWTVNLVFTLEHVPGDKPEDALANAARLAHGRPFQPDRVHYEIAVPANAPRLYPEYSRQFLEILYHQVGAAIRQAAIEKLGGTEGVDEQLARWMDDSKEMARKVSGAIALRHVEGTPQ